MGMPLTHRRFTVHEYHRMAETGILAEDERVELLDGQIVPMTPIGPRHAGCLNALTAILSRRLADAALIAVQNPVQLETYEEPQPDIAVLQPRPDAYRSAHPRPGDVLLLIEVADTTAGSDREIKLPLYARCGVDEVWIVDLVSEQIEVYCEPRGGTYTHRRSFGRGATLSAIRLPGLVIDADEILG